MIGVNLGKTIERVDKNTVTIMPTKTLPTPTVVPLAFETFGGTECGVSFLYPHAFTKKISSDSAALTFNKDQIKVTCKKEDITSFTTQKAEYKKVRDETINNQKIPIYEINSNETFSLFNAFNAKTIVFITPKNLTALILHSVEFTLK